MIDGIDREIVLRLQEDSRLSNAALAKSVGLTVSSVHERIKKLEKKGIIKGYRAAVEADLLGKPIMAFIRLTVSSERIDYVESKQRVQNICQAEADVLECHGVAGDDCYIIKVRARSPKDLEKLIERIRSNAQVSKTTTSIVLSTFKDHSPLVPV